MQRSESLWPTRTCRVPRWCTLHMTAYFWAENRTENLSNTGSSATILWSRWMKSGKSWSGNASRKPSRLPATRSIGVRSSTGKSLNLLLTLCLRAMRSDASTARSTILFPMTTILRISQASSRRKKRFWRKDAGLPCWKTVRWSPAHRPATATATASRSRSTP